MEKIYDVVLDATATIIALTALIFTVISNKNQRREINYIKNLDLYAIIFSNKDIFIGLLKAYGVTEEMLVIDNLTTEQLMYYANLLIALWVRSIHPDKKWKRINKLLESDSYDEAYLLAKEINSRYPILYKGGQTFRMIQTEGFIKSWQYLESLWSYNSIIRLLVNVTISENPK